jgi:putative FmdB family regulatory protein
MTGGFEGEMPIYEYRCGGCGKEFQRLVLKAEEERKLRCPACNGKDLEKLISQVRYHVSEGARLEAYNPGGRQGDDFYRDSRNIGLHAKKRAQQMGIDLGGSFEEKLEKLRTDPGSVLRDSK